MIIRALTTGVALLLAAPRFALAQDAATPPSVPTTSVSAGSASLRPGDIVRIRIWREPDLSGDFPVNESGIVVLPKLGEESVLGRPAATLASDIRAGYAESIAHNSIAVIFLRRVQVIGAVRTPGLYHADPTMTVGDVVALAGGPTPQAKIDRVELYRDGHLLPGAVSNITMVGDTPIRSGDQILVPERSWASRNPGVVVAAVGTTVSVTVALIRLIKFNR
jgi:polysaccharide export outer membrane protein